MIRKHPVTKRIIAATSWFDAPNTGHIAFQFPRASIVAKPIITAAEIINHIFL